VSEAPAEVLVAGGGPAGSVMAWSLARKGIRTIVLDRAGFPREKVCGDYVDPRGLAILDAMGCLEELERDCSRPITATSTYVDWSRRYDGPIPFYGFDERVPPHGRTISRRRLDATLIAAAARAGADVHERTAVMEVAAGRDGVEIIARRGSRRIHYRGRLLVGADGVNSVVARRLGVEPADSRRTVLAQRAYASIDDPQERAAGVDVFFEESLFPGYGWVFPTGDGSANVGIGLLAEARERSGGNIPELFGRFIEGLRRDHPLCGSLELCSKPIGGVVRTYGAAGTNRFDGGLLVGDAGCFVDPMTGEGITPAMESALLAVPTIVQALESGDCSAGALAGYEHAFRDYFDQSMIFLDFLAGVARNRHFARPWLKALARGFERAGYEDDFARTSGSFFCGLDIRPYDIIGQVWMRILEDTLLAWPRLLGGADRAGETWTSPRDLLSWQLAFARSLLDDAAWHARWMRETRQQWSRLLSRVEAGRRDPRAEGVLPA